MKSIEIKQTRDENDRNLYALSQKKFETIVDLVSHYRTYDFAEVADGSGKQILYRLGRPLPRQTWQQELERQAWYQPHLTRKQAEELLSSVSRSIEHFIHSFVLSFSMKSAEEMTFLIRESSARTRQDYTISIYSNNCIRHSPIYREGFDLMLMSKTFTSLIELVHYFSHKPIFQKLILKKPAKSYAEFLNEQNRSESQGMHKNNMTFRPLDHHISLKLATIRAGLFINIFDHRKDLVVFFAVVDVDENPNDRFVKIQLCICEEDRKGLDGYFLKFDCSKDCRIFLSKIGHVASLHLPSDDTISIASSVEKTPTKTLANTSLPQQSQWCAAEYSKLIIYCQGVKLKELDINKAQDLLGRRQTSDD